ncbi:hypothetical protein CTI12_AA528250 [Artemisia annua]|uniref:Uncharacterized protein n=1 Tax=Artemisia annua TaxID=35608 RepID=A0A2U1L5G1_ARTAN|nr:hypothetical protein CTI12_AA528250 [Artemisia annua]
MAGMSKPLRCENGCKLTKQQRKCIQTLRHHYLVCPRRDSRWKVIRDAENEMRRLEEAEMRRLDEEEMGRLDEEAHAISDEEDEEEEEMVGVERRLSDLKMNRRVERQARKEWEKTMKKEKLQKEFKAEDDVIALKKGINKHLSQFGFLRINTILGQTMT